MKYCPVFHRLWSLTQKYTYRVINKTTLKVEFWVGCGYSSTPTLQRFTIWLACWWQRNIFCFQVGAKIKLCKNVPIFQMLVHTFWIFDEMRFSANANQLRYIWKRTSSQIWLKFIKSTFVFALRIRSLISPYMMLSV